MNVPAVPPDWDAIARYLSGESSTEEAAVVRAWLEANPADRELVQQLNSVASTGIIVDPADVDVEAALARAHRRMSDTPRPKLSLERGAPSPSLRRVRWVAGIAGLATAAATVFMVNRSPKTPPAEAHQYATGVGKRDSVVLAEGSRVILGPQSSLEVPADFGVKTRTVVLTGDGYFDVRHDSAKPFQVRANGALIEDVGTTFVVESDDVEGTSVAVMTGIVQLTGNASATPLRLEAGDRGAIDAQGRARVDRKAVRGEDSAWVAGRLAFRDAPLSKVAAEMERWYGVKIRVADSTLRSRHITTSFDGESVDQALRILGLTMGATIERRGDSVIVTPTHGSATPR